MVWIGWQLRTCLVVVAFSPFPDEEEGSESTSFNVRSSNSKMSSFPPPHNEAGSVVLFSALDESWTMQRFTYG